MVGIGSKKALEVVLSKLKGFNMAKVRDEQYITPPSIAAEILWKGYMNDDIEGKVIVDLGCGTGVLGTGCLLLGASKVIFVDKDEKVMDICKQNVDFIKSEGYTVGKKEFLVADVREKMEVSDRRVDLVVTNPPFGTKERHADRDFLQAALHLSGVTYSFHKSNTKEYIAGLAEKNGSYLTEEFGFKFMLSGTMAHHMKTKHYIDVSCFRFEKA